MQARACLERSPPAAVASGLSEANLPLPLSPGYHRATGFPKFLIYAGRSPTATTHPRIIIEQPIKNIHE